MQVTLINIVKLLEQQGHRVQYFVRKDGSIRITKLDGRSYSGSAGNIAAREMAGFTLSEARSKQLEKIRSNKGEFGHRRKSVLPEELVKKIRRVQGIWRRNKVKAEGHVGRRGVRYTLEHYGYEEAMRQLNEQERYARGLAYSENIKWITDYIRDQIIPKAPAADKEHLRLIIDLIELNSYRIKESDIGHIHDLLYDYRDGKKTVQQVVAEISKLYQ